MAKQVIAITEMRSEVFATQTSSVHRRVEAFTSCLELFDTYGTPLVRIQQALNL
jgi:hypothetical protein